MEQPSLIIDGGTQWNRCFWIARKSNLSTSTGRFVGDIYLFLNSILSIKKMFNAKDIFIAWDKKLDTTIPNFRKALSAGNYKNNRQHFKFNVYENELFAIDLVSAYGVKNIFPSSLEADDIVYFLSRKLGIDWIVISTDQDLYQTVDEHVSFYHPIKKKLITKQNFKEVVGVETYDYVLYKAIVGDPSDNIRGVPRHGPVKARKLIEQMHSGNFVLEQSVHDRIMLNRQLIDLSLLFEESKMSELESYQTQYESSKTHVMNRDRFIQICKELEFKSILEKIDKGEI